jgi:hypothetical protein
MSVIALSCGESAEDHRTIFRGELESRHHVIHGRVETADIRAERKKIDSSERNYRRKKHEEN